MNAQGRFRIVINGETIVTMAIDTELPFLVNYRRSTRLVCNNKVWIVLL